MYSRRIVHVVVLSLTVVSLATVGPRIRAFGADANGDGAAMPMDQPAMPGARPGGMGRGRMGADDSPMAGMMRRMHGMMAMHAAGCGGGMLRLDHIEGRIAYMKAELSITPQQLAAWNAFADALRHAAAGARVPAGPPAMDGGWPQRMAGAEHALSDRLAVVQALTGPVRDLYTVLSPAQRTVADQMTGAAPGGIWP